MQVPNRTLLILFDAPPCTVSAVYAFEQKKENGVTLTIESSAV
jgi:hypothetical protein